MPTKLNRAGKQQNYVPAGNGDASGEYGNHTGSNKHFKTFKKQDSAFDAANKQRLGGTMSAQPKQPQPQKPILSAPTNYEEWEKNLLTAQRVGNPPEEVKVSLKDTPIGRIDDTDIKAAKLKYKPETVEKAAALIQRYEKVVDNIAQNLEGIADKTGGMMVGMGFRLKRLPSLSRKIESEIVEQKELGNPNVTVDDVIGKMKDTARFTMMFKPENFENDVQKAMGELQRQGYKMVKAKNTFVEGSGYKGLNCNFVDQQGNIFELQFHIPISMQVKEGIYADLDKRKIISDRTKVTAHDMYETNREIETKMKKGTATKEEIALYKDLTKKSLEKWSVVPNFEFAFLK